MFFIIIREKVEGEYQFLNENGCEISYERLEDAQNRVRELRQYGHRCAAISLEDLETLVSLFHDDLPLNRLRNDLEAIRKRI